MKLKLIVFLLLSVPTLIIGMEFFEDSDTRWTRYRVYEVYYNFPNAQNLKKRLESKGFALLIPLIVEKLANQTKNASEIAKLIKEVSLPYEDSLQKMSVQKAQKMRKKLSVFKEKLLKGLLKDQEEDIESTLNCLRDFHLL